MNNKFSPAVIFFSFAAVILGGTAGYFVPDIMLSVGFIGKLYLNILKIIAIPFAITMIIAGVASMGSRDKVKRSLGKTALYFTITSISASVLGVILSLLIQPGIGVSKSGAVFPEELIDHFNNFSFNKLLSSIIPDNFLSASLEMQVFGVILFALLLGTVLTNVDRKNKIVLDFFVSLKQMLTSLMRIIILIAPVGLFSLSGTLFAQNWQQTQILFSSGALFTVTIVFGLSFFALVILPIVLRFFSTVSPYEYFTSMLPALSTAFATNSSIATLPVTEECVQKSSIDQRASAFVLPLGSLFNSAGTAFFLSAAALFVAQMYGLTITVGQLFIVAGISVVIASLSSFIPYASLLILALVMDIANFPVSAIAGISVIVLVDFLFGRLRTVVDVWSDAVGTAILGNTFDFKTARSAKAAIPIKRPYSNSKPNSTREYSNTKTEFPKTKRENKPRFEKKPFVKHNNKEEAPLKEIIVDTKSPFQISPEKNYLSETELSPTTPDIKTNDKYSKPSGENNSDKTAKNGQTKPKRESTKTSPAPKKEIKKQDRPKPIIHKIEVPPLPVVRKREEKPPEIQEIVPVANNGKKDDDAVIIKSSAKISQDTIERERAKIAAQLNQMREKESQIKITKEEITEKIEPEDLDIKKMEIPSVESFTKIDYYAQEKQDDTPAEVEKPRDEYKSSSDAKNSSAHKSQVSVESNSSVSTLDAPDEKSENIESPDITTDENNSNSDQKQQVSYGRKSSKKTAIKTNENTDSKPQVSEKNEFEAENMSFGRTKRKK